MKLYYISIPALLYIDIQTARGTILDYLFPYIIPWKLIGHEIDQIFDLNDVMYDIVYCQRYHRESVQLFITS